MDGFIDNDTLFWPSLGLLFFSCGPQSQAAAGLALPFTWAEKISWGPLSSILERQCLTDAAPSFRSQALSYLEFFLSFSSGHFVCVCVCVTLEIYT